MTLSLQALHPSMCEQESVLLFAMLTGLVGRWREARHLLIKHLPAFTAAGDVERALHKRNVPGVANGAYVNI